MPLELIPVIHRTTHRIGLSIARASALKVSQAEAHLLAHLAVQGDSTIAALHRAFAHQRSTLTSIFDRMEQRGLITREVSAADRRSFLVRLTRTGKTLSRRVLKHLETLEHNFGLSPAEAKNLHDLLARVENSFRR